MERSRATGSQAIAWCSVQRQCLCSSWPAPKRFGRLLARRSLTSPRPGYPLEPTLDIVACRLNAWQTRCSFSRVFLEIDEAVEVLEQQDVKAIGQGQEEVTKEFDNRLEFTE
eukprot:7612293-Pyramimonas_sp.AAC.1